MNAFGDVLIEPPEHPLLVIATHVTGFDPGWPGQSRVLGGLPTGIAASLFRGTPARSSSGFENRIVLPLYIVQLVRFAIEGGSNPPARLADLIALRIERLSPEARRGLQAIAVLGDSAGRDDLKRLLPDIENLDAPLGLLSDAGMIEQHMDGFATSHPLIRDITLATTPAAVRRDLHSRAPYDANDEPLPLPLEVQAMHAFYAQSSFEALMLLEQSADRATTRGDARGSILALRRGLELARRELFRGEIDDPIRAVLIFSRKLGEALARSGALTDADGVLREALDLAGPSGPERARVLGALAFVARERARAREASSYLHEALEIARQSAANDLVSSLERMRRDWMIG
jgi:serine/threonine-protein kinase